MRRSSNKQRRKHLSDDHQGQSRSKPRFLKLTLMQIVVYYYCLFFFSFNVGDFILFYFCVILIARFYP